jgi:D-alanyl-D-alanine carboxypeptidase
MNDSLRLTLSVALLTGGCSAPIDDRADSPRDNGSVGVTTSAFSHEPPLPVPGSDFVAERAFVGDPLRGLGAGEAGNLFVLDAGDGAGMASTTKSFTLLLAAEAVASGVVSLDDWVTISTKAGTINNNHSRRHSNAGLAPGDVVRFEDLLYAVMLPSAGDASIAVGQHIAVKTFPAFASATDVVQENVFTAMMNQRAIQLGLDDTVFFNAYGGDHAHADDNTPIGDVPHRATTRDMVRWFDFGMSSSALFRTVAGFQGTWAFAAQDGKAFSFSQGFGYPGVRGQKGGSNTACGNCLISSSRRIGRDVLVAYTQGQAGDGVTLFDYGFAKLFHPQEQAESPNYTGGWSKSALACVTSDRAASAVVQANGDLRILLWGLDLERGSIAHLNETVVRWTPPGHLALGLPGGGGRDAGGPGGGPRRPPGGGLAIFQPPPEPGFGFVVNPPGGGGPVGPGNVTTGGKPLAVSDARIAYAGGGNLVVAAETDKGIYLYSYGITGNDTVVQRDLELVGQGSRARVAVLHSTLVVTAHRNAAGSLELKSWQLDPLTGKLSNPLAISVGPGIPDTSELELAARPGLSPQHDLLVAHQGFASQRSLRSFQVTHNSGAISAQGELVWAGSASHLAVAPVTGFGTSRRIYGLAFRDAQGRLTVESYELTGAGTLWTRGRTTDILGGPNQLAADAELRISAYREGGVAVVVQPHPSVPDQRVDAWSFDRSATSTAITPARIATRTFTGNRLSGACRVPNLSAEGDILVSTGQAPLEGLRLRAFRSGPR